MLFKLSVGNMRKSLKDYAIYFFTLLLGVSIFYVFNAIETQSSFMVMSNDIRYMVQMLTRAISGVSIFVAFILGLLIVYASRFLMKRRSKEFALYLTLGMSKGEISAILLIETFFIGVFSLAAGIILGIGLSQLMSAFVASLFEADMTKYRFTVSADAIKKTITYFALIYVFVIIFNGIMISRCKLIDLIQSGRKNEKNHMKKMWLCVAVFVVSAIALGYAYYQVAFNPNLFTDYEGDAMILYIAIGCVATLLIFWSVSGMLLRLVSSVKKLYFKGLNSFTFRQLSGKVNTTVVSMTVICLMMFVAICTLTSAFTIRNSLNGNIDKFCCADIQISMGVWQDYNEESEPTEEDADILRYIEYNNLSILDKFDSYVVAKVYNTQVVFSDEAYAEDSIFRNASGRIISLSDYNKLMEYFGKETVSLDEDEYILSANIQLLVEEQNKMLEKETEINVFGTTLRPKYKKCIYNDYEISGQEDNMGFYIVPDSAVEGNRVYVSMLTANYKSESKADKYNDEKELLDKYYRGTADYYGSATHYFSSISSKIAITTDSIGVGALVTFLGLYIGVVFLISCALIIALKELSDAADSVGRYEMLRKIGADEKSLMRSVFSQSAMFFGLPLLVAVIHSFFGMKFAMRFIELFGADGIAKSIAVTSLIILFIYGGYFLITYLCEKSILRNKMK